MNFLIVLITFFLMEGITWLTHKYVMHGFLWSLHKDHHDHSRKGKMERNDYFFIIFAVPAIAMMYYGSTQGFNHWFYIGLGVTIYGFAYFFVHDIFLDLCNKAIDVWAFFLLETNEFLKLALKVLIFYHDPAYSECPVRSRNPFI